MFFDKTAEKGMDKDMSTKKTNNEKAAEKEMDNNLKVFYVGITPKHKGYHYITALLTEKVRSGVDFEKYIVTLCDKNSIKKGTLIKRMQYAINYAWDMNTGSIRELFPFYKYPPSPIEFLFVMSWELKKEKPLV